VLADRGSAVRVQYVPQSDEPAIRLLSTAPKANGAPMAPPAPRSRWNGSGPQGRPRTQGQGHAAATSDTHRDYGQPESRARRWSWAECQSRGLQLWSGVPSSAACPYAAVRAARRTCAFRGFQLGAGGAGSSRDRHRRLLGRGRGGFQDRGGFRGWCSWWWWARRRWWRYRGRDAEGSCRRCLRKGGSGSYAQGGIQRYGCFCGRERFVHDLVGDGTYIEYICRFAIPGPQTPGVRVNESVKFQCGICTRLARMSTPGPLRLASISPPMSPFFLDKAGKVQSPCADQLSWRRVITWCHVLSKTSTVEIRAEGRPVQDRLRDSVAPSAGPRRRRASSACLLVQPARGQRISQIHGTLFGCKSPRKSLVLKRNISYL